MREKSLNLIPFSWLRTKNSYHKFVAEKIPNILLFIPFGFFLASVLKNSRKLSKLIKNSFIVTFSIEFIQFFIGRVADIDDIIMNLLGSMMGYSLFKLVNYYLKSNLWWNQFLGNIEKIAKKNR